MMRKINLFFILPVMILLLCSTRSMAQGQDANYKWVGNELSTVIGNSNADMNAVYLYNVGTGKYLNVGSIWGTSISAYNVGMRLKLTKISADTYHIEGVLETDDGHMLGFPHVHAGDEVADKQSSWDRVFCDRISTNAYVDWTIKETSSGSKTYTLYCKNDATPAIVHGNRYLVVDPTASGSNRLSFIYPTDPTSYGANAQWKFITLQDLKDAFKAQFASSEAPADATFLLTDPDFMRSHKGVGKWVVSGLQQNYLPAKYAFNQEQPNTYYVGMGQMNAWPDKYTRQYGSYWIASIRNLGNNAHANGSVTQKVNVLKKGWYRVSCDGFYSPGAGSNLKASIFANVTGSSDGRSVVSNDLNVFGKEFNYTKEELTKTYKAVDVGTESPYIKAAKRFETGIYNNAILVYVPADGDELNIGIKVSGSDKELDWTAFDNFQLRYCGDNDMVLDEMQTSLDYLTKQALVPTNAYTLILKRTIKTGLWSSITLPVSLTAAQFKTAFGEQAKLARLKGQDTAIPSRIDFEKVDLSNNDATVIEPSKLYIMQTTRKANVETGSYSKRLNDGSQVTVQAPYYTINNVVLPTVPSPIFRENAHQTTTVSGDIQFCGTQINQTTTIIPAHSYVLGAKDGKWYHTANALPVKGFRCWIATNVNAASPAKPLTFTIDGELQGSTTAIEGLHIEGTEASAHGAVYNLQGQKVADDASQMGTLPRGIYVVNHKKIMIK